MMLGLFVVGPLLAVFVAVFVLRWYGRRYGFPLRGAPKGKAR